MHEISGKMNFVTVQIAYSEEAFNRGRSLWVKISRWMRR